MKICVRNAKNEILGYYEAEELDNTTAVQLMKRDFTDGVDTLEVNDEVTVAEEDMATDQWIASLIDRIQNLGWLVQYVDKHIIIYIDSYHAKAVFHNWSEVEFWLNETES